MILPLLLVLAQHQPLTGLDAYVTQAMKDWRVPGLAIVVVQGDSTLFMKGYGVRELGKPDPVTVSLYAGRIRKLHDRCRRHGRGAAGGR